MFWLPSLFHARSGGCCTSAFAPQLVQWVVPPLRWSSHRKCCQNQFLSSAFRWRMFPTVIRPFPCFQKSNSTRSLMEQCFCSCRCWTLYPPSPRSFEFSPCWFRLAASWSSFWTFLSTNFWRCSGLLWRLSFIGVHLIWQFLFAARSGWLASVNSLLQKGFDCLQHRLVFRSSRDGLILRERQHIKITLSII